MAHYYNIVFLQGTEAEEALAILENEGKDAALVHLMQWDNGEYGDYLGTPKPWGRRDQVYETEGGHVMSWNSALEYIGLCRWEEDPFTPRQDIRSSCAPLKREEVDIETITITVGYEYRGTEAARRRALLEARENGRDFMVKLIQLADDQDYDVNIEYQGDI